MKETLSRLSRLIEDRLQGMYGFDPLSGVIIVLAAVLLALAGSDHLFVWLFALLLLAAGCFRAFSQDHEARAAENEKFMALLKRPRAWLKSLRVRWENRNTKAYVRCPECHKQFALPKGKGTLRATCPYCGEKSVHKV